MSDWQPVCRESYPALYEYLLTMEGKPNKDGVCLSDCWDFGLKDGVPVFDQRKVYVPFDGSEAFQWKVFIGKAELELDGYGPTRAGVHSEMCEGFDYDPMAPDAAYWWTIIGEATDCIHDNVSFTVGEIPMPMVFVPDSDDYIKSEDFEEVWDEWGDFVTVIPVWVSPSQTKNMLSLPKGSEAYAYFPLTQNVCHLGKTQADVGIKPIMLYNTPEWLVRCDSGVLKIDLPGNMVRGIMPCDRAELKTKDSQ